MKKLFTLLMTLCLAVGSLFAVDFKGGEILFLTPCDNWINNAKDHGGGKPGRYAAYFFGNGEKWVGMTAVPGETEFYQVTAPSGYKNVIFCAMNPSTSGLTWADKWNQTGDLSYDGKNNHYTVKNGTWDQGGGTWSLYALDPVITIVKTPEFATTTVEETSTATVTYKVENSEEKPALSVDNDAFKAEIEAQGTIIITFAPTEAKEYTATLTLTIGEVKQTVEIKATAKAADAPAVPEILNLAAGKIAEIFAGETTEFEISYTLLNAEEATTSIQGEGFSIKKQDKGTATIEFAPTEAKTYSAVITVTSGDATKTLEIEATAKKVPTVITISFVNSAKWEEVALYAWGAEGLPSSWPGEKMTKGDNDTYTYQLTIPEDGKYSFIINNNQKDNATQTVDVEGVAESTCFVLGTANNEGKYSLVVSANCEAEEPEPEPDPIEPYVSIRGLGEGTDVEKWSQAQEIKLTYQAQSDNGPQWYILGLEIAEGQQFKVVAIAADATETWYGVEKVEYNENLGSYIGDDNITLPAGKYDLYFKVENTSMWIAPVTAPEPEPEPEPADPIITILEEDFTHNEVEVGEETEAIVVYSLENAESAVVTLEGEYFTMEEYPEEVEGQGNYIEITFAPEQAGEYTCKLTITAGEVSQVLEHTFYATEPTPDTEIISIKVAAPENWESCYLWAWEIGGKDLFDTFPGVSMPKGEDGFYVMNLEISGPIGFMVSNGAGIQTTGYTDVAEDMCFDVVSVESNLILEVNENCEYVAPEIPKVTFTVLVPGGTQVCYIAGTPQWSPIEMEKVEGEENMFTITTDLLNGQEWKYCAGPNFDYVEVTADGGDVKNRTEYGNPDVVAAWKAVYEPQPDVPTAVEEVEALGIYATDGTIYADDAIIIYTLAGVDVTVQNGSLYGIYIVKTANGSQLINVR